MKKTFEEMLQFIAVANNIVKKYPNTKLEYAIKKVAKRIEPIIKEYNEKLEEIKIKHCYTNEKGVIEYNTIKDANGNEQLEYKYTKEGMLNRMKDQKQLWEEYRTKEFDIEPFLINEEDLTGITLTNEEMDVLKGFVI